MIVILHNIRSLHNVGSVFRTADAIGVEKIYLCGITPTPIDAFGKPRGQFTKVSLGAEKYVKWEYYKSTTRLIDKLKKAKPRYKIFAVEQNKKSTSHFKLRNKDLKFKVALIFGNEVRGLPESVLERADKILEIPMSGKKESLNVSVAFGVIGFHLLYLLKYNND